MANLLLIPTPTEFELLEPRLVEAARQHDWLVELCGFGPIAAAARTAQLLAIHQPAQVLLIGIAGTYRTQLPVGTALRFANVACEGVGVGTGNQHQTAGQVGWPHWQASDSTSEIGDVISLSEDSSSDNAGRGQLLTCCAASANPAEAQFRIQRFPAALAEDMEGFGVACACQLAGVPLQIARGLSNQAGDRDKRHWRVAAALEAVTELACASMANL